jgi:hypothetical protein
MPAPTRRWPRAAAQAATPATDPAGEARRFLAARQHWFAALETRAEALSAEIDSAGGSAEWLRRNGLRVRAMPASVMMGALARYDRHNEQLLLDECLGRSAAPGRSGCTSPIPACALTSPRSCAGKLCQRHGSATGPSRPGRTGRSRAAHAV